MPDSDACERPVVVVTGSSRGLGREVALRFARGGWNVIVHCVRSAGAAREVARLARQSGGAAVVQGEIAGPETQASLVRAAVERWGRLDCLVNNAAALEPARIVSLTEAAWDEMLAVDLAAPMALARRAAAVMRPGSSIVNVVSICGLWGCGGVSAYSAAKGALAGFTSGVAAEFARRGVRINAVAPGYLPTDMGKSAPEAMQQARSRHAMGILSDPGVAAEFIFRLAGMSGVSGQVLVLDGRIR